MSNRFWMTYWDKDSWHNNEDNEGGPFDHTAGNNFTKRGVLPGDAVYVVSMSEGRLLLGGKMIVGKILDHKGAVKELGDEDLYEAEEHLIGAKGKSTPLNFHRQVPLNLTKQLRFVSKTSPSLEFDSPTKLNNQTLRAVRELTMDSAIRLDHFMEDTRQYVEQPILIPIYAFEEGFAEGGEKLRTHLIRERNPLAVKAAKEHWKKSDPLLHCDVCDFSFVERYGDHADGYIEAHHTKPLGSLKAETKTLVTDLAKVCANCHRMLHKKNGCLTVKQLRAMLRSE